MAGNKTKATEAGVDAFLDGVADPGRRADATALRAIMEQASGEPARMWGPGIVGFGAYRYKYDSGREGEMCRIGFSPRAKELVLYLKMDGRPWDQALMDRLGRHRSGKGCLYIKRLDDVDGEALAALIGQSLDYMRAHYPEG